MGLGGAACALLASGALGCALLAENPKVDFKALEADIRTLIESAGKYDDGSYGPLLIRLAWHSAGNYSKFDHTGGTNGATMRFAPESNHGGNAGLHIARNLLEPLKAKYPGISYADLYTLAGTVAIEALGGKRPYWRPGRRDYAVGEKPPTPDGRLPDASQGADHLRSIFYRMGFTDQEIVALSGAHALGRCHKDRSGFEGPWTFSPTVLDNSYFRLLKEEKWTERKWAGPRQFQDSSGKLMMLPSDIALTQDPAFASWVDAYAEDEDRFQADFARAWSKLMELGVEYQPKPVLEKLFG
jgi:cytochrome c peroxidase